MESPFIEERVVEEIFKIIQDDEAFKTAILNANSKKGMINELKEKKIFFEKEIKKSLVRAGLENLDKSEGGLK
jgi:hypothetical protein